MPLSAFYREALLRCKQPYKSNLVTELFFQDTDHTHFQDLRVWASRGFLVCRRAKDLAVRLTGAFSFSSFLRDVIS